MNGNFDKAFALTLKNEGVDSNDPLDPGGRTRFGISQTAFPNEDIANLTVERARELYLENYWKAASCDLLPSGIDIMVFDCAVNQGVDTAVRLLQQACGVKVDGQIGPMTLSASAAPTALLMFAVQRAMKYFITRNFLTYGKGWITRLFTVYDFARDMKNG